MPKKLPENLNERLTEFLSRHGPEGMAGVLREFPQASKRTLQRRLKLLEGQGIVEIEGAGRSLRYKAAKKPVGPFHGDPYVPVSVDGAEIRDLVRSPIHERRPVPYDRTLLEAYTPNESRYLHLKTRLHLQSMGAVEGHERPAGTYARSILDRLLIDLSWASSRLEGNTYTRLDTMQLIQFGQAAEGKDRTEAQMILNHKAAIELLIDNADSVGFNRFTLKNLHAALADNLLHDPTEAGRLRTRIVQVSGTVYQPLSVPQELERLFDVILEKAQAIEDPFEQAFFVMVHLPYLQAFVDVNKRVSRLAANIPLIRRNLVPLSFIDVPERAYVEGTLGVYELGRIELLRDVFTWAYERSCHQYAAIKETVREPDPLRLRYREHLSLAVRDIVKGCDEPDRRSLRASSLTVGIPADDADAFVDMVLRDLAMLHPGNIARYRIRLAEYQAWQKIQAAALFD